MQGLLVPLPIASIELRGKVVVYGEHILVKLANVSFSLYWCLHNFLKCQNHFSANLSSHCDWKTDRSS